jgi:tRNA pseudouridine55 synthase
MAPKIKNPISGWINLHKPEGVTSNDAVMVVKRALGFPKIGHAGTLDPLASGILPIALGEATKLVQYMMDDDKVYLFTVTWGEQRTTDDREGEVMATSPIRPTSEQIYNALPEFRGVIQQTPPTYSAIKVDGQRAYDMARRGEDVELAARPVSIYELNLVDSNAETAVFRCVCGKGTYVRSLARDIAEKLGTKGYVSQLTRENVGPFGLSDAISLDFFRENPDKANLKRIVLPVQTVLDDIPVLAVTDTEASRLKNGQKLTFIARPDVERLVKAGHDIKSSDGGIMIAMHHNKALAMLDVMGVEAQPVRVFNL